jgi:hypothetical protein
VSQAYNPAMPSYDHTQRGLWHWMILAIGLVMGGAGVYTHEDIPAVCALVVFLAAAAFARLRVWDDGEALCARLGPLPLLGTRIAYADIQSVEVTRTKWYHGWGLHALPGAWLVVNLWGFDAVALNLKHRRGLLRCRRYLIGTDEPEALAEFVEGRLTKAAMR